MKRLWIGFAAGAILLIAATSASADGRFSIHADYNAPISTSAMASNVEFGAQYKFWGIFLFEGSIFTDIQYGANNLFNIASITPIGLFSAGFGMRIPLGGFALELGFDPFFTGFGNTGGVYHYCDSYNFGIQLNLTRHFGLRFYDRVMYNFTPLALVSRSFGITSTAERVNTLGGGVILHLF